MVHAKQPAAAFVVQGHETDVVVVIAELFRLRGGGLVHHIEFRRICGDRIAPPQQDLRIVAGGDVVGLIIAPRQFVKDIAALGGIGLGRGDGRSGAEKRGGGGNPKHAAQDVAAAIAGVDHIADGARQVRVGGDVVKGLKGFGLVADGGVVEDIAAGHHASFGDLAGPHLHHDCHGFMTR